MNRGRGAEWLFDVFNVEQRKPDRWTRGEWTEAEGYSGRDTPFAGPQLEQYQKFVAKGKVSSRAPVPITAALRGALEKVIGEVRATGAEAILVISPSLVPADNFSELPTGVPVWSYRGPNQFPGLYDPANRFDTGHLNSAGAEIYTDMLALRFARQITGEQ